MLFENENSTRVDIGQVDRPLLHFMLAIVIREVGIRVYPRLISISVSILDVDVYWFTLKTPKVFANPSPGLARSDNPGIIIEKSN